MKSDMRTTNAVIKKIRDGGAEKEFVKIRILMMAKEAERKGNYCPIPNFRRYRG